MAGAEGSQPKGITARKKALALTWFALKKFAEIFSTTKLAVTFQPN
jgi:hypothetical protein